MAHQANCPVIRAAASAGGRRHTPSRRRWRTAGRSTRQAVVLRLLHIADGHGVDRIVRQIQLQRLRAGEVDALIGLVPVAALLPVELEGIAEAVDELAALAQTDDAHVRRLEGDLAGADDHIAPGLDQVQIGTRQRAPQLEGRNGKVVAVHRGRQILEARAAPLGVRFTKVRLFRRRLAGCVMCLEP